MRGHEKPPWMSQLHDLFRMRVRQRAQEDRVDDAEDGAVRADAKREREHGDDAETRRLPERTKRELDRIHPAGTSRDCRFKTRTTAGTPRRRRPTALLKPRMLQTPSAVHAFDAGSRQKVTGRFARMPRPIR
jgi:hypothetical protein